MRWLTVFGVFLVLLACGCIEGPESRYVCPDGHVVGNPDLCESSVESSTTTRQETTATKEIPRIVYICPDGKLVNKSDECAVEETVPETTVTTTVKPTSTTTIRTVPANKTSSTSTTTIFNDEDLQNESTTTTTETSTPTTVYEEPEETTTSSTIHTTISTTIITTANPCTDFGCDEDTMFVGSKNSDKYHYCNCSMAKRIKLENIVCFKSVEDAKNQGYVPCGTCKPPG